MSVVYHFVNKDNSISSIYNRGCFGTLIYGDKYNTEITSMQNATHLIYTPHLRIKHISSFKKRYIELCEHFPWISEIVEVIENDKETVSKISNTSDLDRSYFKVGIKINLDNHSDTIWFCLNTIRFIAKVYHEYSSSKIEDYEKKVNILGIWRALILEHSYYFSKDYNGENIQFSINSQYNFGHTCMFTPFQSTIEFFKQAVSNPLINLNKYPKYYSTEGSISFIPDPYNRSSVEEGYGFGTSKYFLTTFGFNKTFVKSSSAEQHLKDTLKSFITEEELINLKEYLPKSVFSDSK